MKTRRTDQRRRGRAGTLVALIATLALVGAAAAYVLWPSPVPSAGGTPRLAVDRTQVDFGDVPFDRFVTASFRLTNAGSGSLTLDASRPVRAVQGC